MTTEEAVKQPAAAKKGSFVIVATGRRKTATARVRLSPGTGTILINGQPSLEYLQRPILQMVITEPLDLLQSTNQYDIKVKVAGGGKAGQAGAVRHGIARALAELDPAFQKQLRASTFLTRDSRMKERKKYGQKGARKRFQFSKR